MQRLLVVATVVGVALAVAVGLLWPLTDMIAAHDVGHVAGALRSARLQAAREAVRTQLLTLGAGLFAAGALLFTARNFILSRQTLQLTEQGQVTDRYTRAIDQLGSDKLDVRIGGIYALERIARDSARDHPTIMEVLAAFVRGHCREQWPPQEPGAPRPAHSTRPDVQAALTVISRRDVTQDKDEIDLRSADLTAASLGGADLSGANLRWTNLANVFAAQANLAGAHFRSADLTSADLSGADLRGTSFTEAKLAGAFMPGADLTGAHLQRADLTSAHLGIAMLTDSFCRGANFTGAKLTGANLAGADLAEANMRNADLASASLARADLTNSDLSTANLADADFTDANLDRVWFPAGAQPPDGWHVDPGTGRLART
jgi:uncharacterized protein YjbI with pentapeptide repeats